MRTPGRCCDTGAVPPTDDSHAEPADDGECEDEALRLSMGIWARGGLTVTGLLAEFRDPGWAIRGQYRALKQFVMNWNNFDSPTDRAAMLDGPPRGMTRDEKARVAALVRCLCERDRHPLPGWVRRTRAARGPHGVFLIMDRSLNDDAELMTYPRLIMDQTPLSAARYRVWFEAEFLESH